MSGPAGGYLGDLLDFLARPGYTFAALTEERGSTARHFMPRDHREKSTQQMATGTVKWFNDAKGFGFISQADGGEDVFCHHTAIQSEGFRSLQEGQKVEFEVKRGPKGLQAANVRPIA